MLMQQPLEPADGWGATVRRQSVESAQVVPALMDIFLWHPSPNQHIHIRPRLVP